MTTEPVAVPCSVRVPDVAASRVRFSAALPPTSDSARPAPAAADLTFKPVTQVAVEESICKVGLVDPWRPTAKELALELVTIRVPATVVLPEIVPEVILPVL